MEQTKNEQSKPYIGVLFECCGVYSRIYREHHEMRYEGRCPKCLKALSVQVDASKGVAAHQLKAR